MFPRFLSISLGCFALGALIAQGASAQSCGTGTCTDEQFCYVGDGHLYDPGLPCIVFEAGFPFPINATLSNYGEFSVGDRVHVEGCAETAISGSRWPSVAATRSDAEIAMVRPGRMRIRRSPTWNVPN